MSPAPALLFSLSAAIVAGAPVLILYLSDPAAFVERMRLLRQAIPTGSEYLGANLAATAFYTALTAPAALLALSSASLHRRRKDQGTAELNLGLRYPLAGALCGIVLPLALLWRDADVQIHPRYTLIPLPAIILVCAGLYDRWMPGARAATAWGLLNILVFGASQFVVQPFRSMQAEKKARSHRVKSKRRRIGLTPLRTTPDPRVSSRPSNVVALRWAWGRRYRVRSRGKPTTIDC